MDRLSIKGTGDRKFSYSSILILLYRVLDAYKANMLIAKQLFANESLAINVLYIEILISKIYGYINDLLNHEEASVAH